MAKFVLKAARLFACGVDLTSVNSKIELSSEVEEKDVTPFNPDPTAEVWRELLAGLASTSVSAEGQWEAGNGGSVDDNACIKLGVVGALTACPAGATVGALAWLTKMMEGSYGIGGQVGDVAPWTAGWSGSWPLARGQVLHPPGTARTTTGSGTAVQLGALSASQALYVTLHVLSASGTTPEITVIVESDDNSGMTSAITQGTFTAASAQGGDALKISGPITDDWWRVSWTITGTTPSFLFVAAAGIGPA